MDIQKIQSLFQERSVKWSTHCLERMQERDILRADVLSCVFQGEIIEDYPNDYPFPSCLIFGHTIQGRDRSRRSRRLCHYRLLSQRG